MTKAIKGMIQSLDFGTPYIPHLRIHLSVARLIPLRDVENECELKKNIRRRWFTEKLNLYFLFSLPSTFQTYPFAVCSAYIVHSHNTKANQNTALNARNKKMKNIIILRRGFRIHPSPVPIRGIHNLKHQIFWSEIIKTEYIITGE